MRDLFIMDVCCPFLCVCFIRPFPEGCCSFRSSRRPDPFTCSLMKLYPCLYSFLRTAHVLVSSVEPFCRQQHYCSDSASIRLMVISVEPYGCPEGVTRLSTRFRAPCRFENVKRLNSQMRRNCFGLFAHQ